MSRGGSEARAAFLKNLPPQLEYLREGDEAPRRERQHRRHMQAFSQTIAERRERRGAHGNYLDDANDALDDDDSSSDYDSDPSSSDPSSERRVDGGGGRRGRGPKSRRTGAAGARAHDDDSSRVGAHAALESEDERGSSPTSGPLSRAELRTLVLFRMRILGMSEIAIQVKTLSKETLRWMCEELGVDCAKLAGAKTSQA